MTVTNDLGNTLTRNHETVYFTTKKNTIIHMFPSERKAKAFTRTVRAIWRMRTYNPALIKKQDWNTLLKGAVIINS